MSIYFSRLSPSHLGRRSLEPSVRSGSPVVEADQRLELAWFPEVPVFAGNRATDTTPNTSPITPVTGAGATRAAPGAAPAIAQRRTMPVAQAVAPPVSMSSSAPQPMPAPLASRPARAKAFDDPSSRAAAPAVAADQHPLARIVEAIARDNSQRTRVDESKDTAVIRPATDTSAPRVTARPSTLERVAPPPLSIPPRPGRAAPVLEIGSIHVEVVSEGLSPDKRVRLQPQARVRAPHAPRESASGLRSKLRFGLRQL